MHNPSKNSLSPTRILVTTALGSLSATALLICARAIVESNNSQPSSNSDRDASKPDGGTASTSQGEAIATPENLPVQQLTELATEQVLQSGSQLPKITVKPLIVSKESLPKPTIAYGQASPLGQRNPLLSLQPISQPETISPGQAGIGDRSDVAAMPLSISLRDIQGHWAQIYIEYLASRSIVQGFPDGRFRPDRAVKAGEFAAMRERAALNAAVPEGTTSISSLSFRNLQALQPSRAVTRAEAAAYIYRALVKTEPVQLVTNVQIRGEVSRPGRYSLAAASDERLGRGNNLPTLSRAIQQAGGALSTADLRQVEIHRISEDTGREKVFKVDVWKVLQAGSMAHDVVIQQGDKVVIPTLTARSQPDFSTSQRSLPRVSTPIAAAKPAPQRTRVPSTMGGNPLLSRQPAISTKTAVPLGSPEKSQNATAIPSAKPESLSLEKPVTPESRVSAPSLQQVFSNSPTTNQE